MSVRLTVDLRGPGQKNDIFMGMRKNNAKLDQDNQLNCNSLPPRATFCLAFISTSHAY